MRLAATIDDTIDDTGRVRRIQWYYLVRAVIAGGFAAGIDLPEDARLMQMFGLVAVSWLAPLLGHRPVQMVVWSRRLGRSRAHTLVWLAVHVVAVTLFILVTEQSTVAGVLLGAGLVLMLEPRYHLSARRFGIAAVRA